MTYNKNHNDFRISEKWHCEWTSCTVKWRKNWMFQVRIPENHDKFRKKDWSQQVEHMQVLNWTGPGLRRSKHPLLACHTSCKGLNISLEEYVNRKVADSSKINIQRGEMQDLGHIWQKVLHGWVDLSFLWRSWLINSCEHVFSWRYRKQMHDSCGGPKNKRFSLEDLFWP